MDRITRYRKLTCSKDKPACAACDITHGGLHLDETAAWKSVKAELGKEGVEIQQLHRDEIRGEVSLSPFTLLFSMLSIC